MNMKQKPNPSREDPIPQPDPAKIIPFPKKPLPKAGKSVSMEELILRQMRMRLPLDWGGGDDPR